MHGFGMVLVQAPIPAEKLEAALRQVLGAEVQLKTAVKRLKRGS